MPAPVSLYVYDYVTRAADPLTAVTLTYLFTWAAAQQQPGRDAGRYA